MKPALLLLALLAASASASAAPLPSGMSAAFGAGVAAANSLQTCPPRVLAPALPMTLSLQPSIQTPAAPRITPAVRPVASARVHRPEAAVRR